MWQNRSCYQHFALNLAKKENRRLNCYLIKEQLRKVKLSKIKNKAHQKIIWSRNSISLEMLMWNNCRIYVHKL
jgi:hypothetical protein